MKNKVFWPILLLLFVAMQGCGKQEVEEHAIISFIIGDVKKNSAEAAIGDVIKESDVIATGANSFCDIRIGDSVIRIKALSSVTISTLFKNGDIENTALGLNTGKILCKPKKLLKSESFIVKTPTAVAGVRGTQFTVETDKKQTTRIKVFSGEVKVVKRVKQLDSSIDKVLENAPVVEEEEKVIITQEDARDAEKAVETALREETGKDETSSDRVLDNVIARTKDDVGVKDDRIEKFKAEEFTGENREIIEVEKKTREDVKRISAVVRQEKTSPVPEGRLLITRFDVYFIKDGKVMWEGRVIGEPAQKGDRLFIAAGEYVFCAMSDGPVIWKKAIRNDGKIELKNDRVIIRSDGKSISLDESTGERK